MKENIKLVSTVFKILPPIWVLFFVSLTIFLHEELQWYYLLLFAAGIMMGVLATYLTVRLHLTIDYENKKIIYYAFKKHIIDFCDVDSCCEKKEVDLAANTWWYVCLKKTDGSVLKISINFIGFKKCSHENVKNNIIRIINNVTSYSYQ